MDFIEFFFFYCQPFRQFRQVPQVQILIKKKKKPHKINFVIFQSIRIKFF